MTSSTRPCWGRYRAAAAHEHPEISWSLLTPAQVDVYLLHLRGVSTRATAAAFGVTQPAVAVHLRRARERLDSAATQAPRPWPPRRAEARICPLCPLPADVADCDRCCAAVMRERP